MLASSLAVRIKAKRKTGALADGSNDDDEFTKHDGLYVDYGKFENLTKGMLKNANILRQKSINSPARITTNSSNSRGNQAAALVLKNQSS